MTIITKKDEFFRFKQKGKCIAYGIIWDGVNFKDIRYFCNCAGIEYQAYKGSLVLEIFTHYGEVLRLKPYQALVLYEDRNVEVVSPSFIDTNSIWKYDNISNNDFKKWAKQVIEQKWERQRPLRRRKN